MCPYEQDVGANEDQGRVYVFDGFTGSILFNLTTPNPQIRAYFGMSVSSGDVNNDGKDDVIVGTGTENVGANQAQGRAYIFDGATGSVLLNLTTPNPQEGAGFGNSVSSGDVNNDGKDDAIVGTYCEDVGANLNQGRAYVFDGVAGSILLNLTTPNPQGDAHFGGSVSSGDVNNDGKDDVIVGAAEESVGSNTYQGRTYVFDGATGSILLNLTTLNPQGYAYFGHSVSSSDVNNDGKDDVIVGAAYEKVGGKEAQGRVYVFDGVTGSILLNLTTPNSQNYAYFGFSVASATRKPITDQIGVFRNGPWYLDYNGNREWDPASGDVSFWFGTIGDMPIAGDWNGDAQDEIGVFRNGPWYLDYNGNRDWDPAQGDVSFWFGTTGDIPVAGDWNGDGQDEIGVFRNGPWYLDYNGNREWDPASGDVSFWFGTSGDLPVAGDWNDDGKEEIGVFRNGPWYLDYNGNREWDPASGDVSFWFGTDGDQPVAGDWNDDGKDEIGVFRNGPWYLDYNGNMEWDPASGDVSFWFGTGGDRPVAGRWLTATGLDSPPVLGSPVWDFGCAPNDIEVRVEITDDVGVVSATFNDDAMVLVEGDDKDGVWLYIVNGSDKKLGDCVPASIEAFDTIGQPAGLNFQVCWLITGC